MTCCFPISYSGLYHDHEPFAFGLLRPPSTLLSVLAIVALIIAALGLRRRLPLFGLAILFFFAGHLIESSAIMLELKFEHRNYLPATLLFLPIAAGILSMQRKLAVLVL